MIENNKYKFAFVSPSMKVFTALKTYSNPNIESILFKSVSMEEAVPLATKLLDQGIEIILAGGATGRLLLESIGHRVVNIDRTFLAIARAVMQGIKITNNLGITSFKTSPEGLNLLENLLNIKIHKIIFNNTEELINGITTAFGSGVECIVGGGVCKEIIDSLGRESIVITPSRDTIIRSLEKARTLAEGRRREKEDAEQLRIILDTISEGVLSVDNNGTTRIINKTASNLLQKNRNNILGKPNLNLMNMLGLSDVMENNIAIIDQIKHIFGKDMVINSLPIKVGNETLGAVATIKELSRIQNIEQNFREIQYSKGFVAKYDIDDFFGVSEAVHKIKKDLPQYAQANANILIQGETGTGKEILAQAIHNHSNRHNKPFVAVNCSALPEALLESELFGYEEGAFTGAKKGGKRGLFELANDGTIFLDEIADISLGTQMRLLRVLEERQVMRVGGDRLTRINVRIIASSYKDLAHEVQKATFRPDLFFRLSILRLNILPLRNRLEDIPIILESLFKRYGAEAVMPKSSIKEYLLSYEWPGNVRQLDAIVTRYLSLLHGNLPSDELFLRILEEIKLESSAIKALKQIEEPGIHPFLDRHKSLKEMVTEFEKKVIEDMLKSTRFNRKEASRKLGISENTLWRKTK